MRGTHTVTAVGLAVALTASPSRAPAFSGFYMNGSGATAVADATHVVLVRQGTRTVVSLQNDYKGPVEDFAMLIPVPTVLKEGDVKALPRAVFERVEAASAPRLVEYWEQDPCAAKLGTDAAAPPSS